MRQVNLDAVRAACATRQEEERETRKTLAAGVAAVRWYMAGGEQAKTFAAFEKLLAFPWHVRQLGGLTTRADVKPCLSIRAAVELFALGRHFRREKRGAENMGLLFGATRTQEESCR